MIDRVRCRYAQWPAVLGILLLPAPGSLLAQDTTAGKSVYVKWCAGCHGDAGAGDGAAAASMLPRPRNFTSGLYKIRTTASGQLPTDADLERAIDEGLPGSAMPGWKGRLSQAERRDVRRGLQGGAPILRLDRVPQMPRRPGEGRRPVGADPQG